MDDREEHIDIAKRAAVCRTLRVAAQGLSEGERLQIAQLCVGGGNDDGDGEGGGGGGGAGAKCVQWEPSAHVCLIPKAGAGKPTPHGRGAAGMPCTVDAAQAGGFTVFLPAATGAVAVVGVAPGSSSGVHDGAVAPPAAPPAAPQAEQRELAMQLLARVEIARQQPRQETRVQLVAYPVADATLLARLALGVSVTHFPVYENGFAGLEWPGLVVGLDSTSSVALLAFEPRVEACDRDAPEISRPSCASAPVRLRRGDVRVYPVKQGEDRLFAHRTTDVAAYQRGSISTTARGLEVKCVYIDAQNGFVFVSKPHDE